MSPTGYMHYAHQFPMLYSSGLLNNHNDLTWYWGGGFLKERYSRNPMGYVGILNCKDYRAHFFVS